MNARGSLGGRSFDATVEPGRVTVDGQAVPVQVKRAADGGWTVTARGRTFHVALEPGRAVVDGERLDFDLESVAASGSAGAKAASGATRVKPPMTGKLESLRVTAGQAVAKGDVLFVLEAMKMHNEVRSPVAGTVTAVHAKPGQALEPGTVVLEIGA